MEGQREGAGSNSGQEVCNLKELAGGMGGLYKDTCSSVSSCGSTTQSALEIHSHSSHTLRCTVSQYSSSFAAFFSLSSSSEQSGCWRPVLAESCLLAAHVLAFVFLDSKSCSAFRALLDATSFTNVGPIRTIDRAVGPFILGFWMSLEFLFVLISTGILQCLKVSLIFWICPPGMLRAYGRRRGGEGCSVREIKPQDTSNNWGSCTVAMSAQRIDSVILIKAWRGSMIT